MEPHFSAGISRLYSLYGKRGCAYDPMGLPVFWNPDYNGWRATNRRKADHRESRERSGTLAGVNAMAYGNAMA